jgi:putative selenate reductase molybdopterin-binding subunit
VFTHFTGGGHGGKTGENSAVISAVMSKAVNGYPVLFINSRHDNMCTRARQFAIKSNIKIGAKKDGTFTGIDAKFFGDGGKNANAPIGNCHFGLRTTYTIPDATFQVTVINTNTPSRTYWRCVNDPPGAQNYDPAIDTLAAKLDMDPYALRMKNLRDETMPDQESPNRYWGGMAAKQWFEWLYTASGYASKWHKPNTKTLPDGRLHGISITGHFDSHGSVGGASRGGIVTMTPDGKMLVNVGGARGCEGGPTMCCHVVAEVMGLKYEDVRLGEWGNTDVSLDAGIQAGSGFTGGAGAAFYNAAMDARNKVFAAAITKTGFKEITGITVADLEAHNSEIIYTKDPTKKLTYRQAMSGTAPTAGASAGWNAGAAGGVGADGRGVGGAQRAKGTIKVGDILNSNGGSAACAEVAVDPETGEVEILGYWNAVDTGRTIFKQGTLKEMGSGVELMIWQGLYAGDVYDAATGACFSSLYTESMLPTFGDFKTERFVLKDIESDDVGGPLGAHGIGEPCVSNYSAITCAIFNATGKWVDPEKGPMTPDKVLKALGKA